MKRRLKEPFGKAGLTVAILALVMAFVGGAYAAGGLTKSQEKQVTKIAKKYAGKPGAPGAAGANGTNGTNGKDGAAGAPGSPGQSVTGAAATAGECPAGGVKYTSASGNNAVCNGKEGKEGKAGKEGSPWTLGGTLPPGATETGTWAVTNNSNTSKNEHVSPISFAVPLKSALGEERAHFFLEGETPSEASGCFGGTAADPKADPGNLCVYVGTESRLQFGLVTNAVDAAAARSASTAGALLTVFLAETEFAFAFGTWAVTAPEEP